LRIKKIITIFFLLYESLFSSDSINSEIWFSKKIDFRNGFEYLQIAIQEKKIILAKLSYNEEKKWEETRIVGLVKELGQGRLLLKPEMCMVYATKKLGLRWILIQGFDCEHLELQITKKEREMFISHSIGITETVTLTKEDDKSKNTTYAIIVSKEEKNLQAWSLGLRYIKKGATALHKGEAITILETVDSTGSFESNRFFRVGDIIHIQNYVQSDFLK
jgi:hypothetical protein